LEFAERARARDLLDALAGSVPHEVGAGTPLTPEAIRHRLGPDSALVYYFVLPDRVLTWVITSRSVQSMQQVMRASEIESLAGILRASVHSPGSSSFRTGSERLYEVLIRPIKPHLQLGETLVFIPAGALQALPFAALRDRRSRQFLVEQHPVAIAPSGSIFVRSTERLRNSSSGHPSLLVFGNPKLRGEAGLPSRLRAAEAEAIQIASLYGDADLRSGATATKGLFLTLAGRHEVVHFAGHAIADTEIPFASRLLLASDDPKDSGVLRADEIANRRFPKTRLAVLAACSTGVGIADRLEGSLSLAWSFLAAGVPSVVISLWDVEDRPSQHLFVNLHRALTAGKDFPVALQEAQLLLLHSGDASLDSPASWGGFEVIGGIGTINERRGENHETSN
jgi:CHAT domain-containing protein